MIQAAFHDNVNRILARQLSAPRDSRLNLHGVVPFGFPLCWNVERGDAAYSTPTTHRPAWNSKEIHRR